MYCQADIVNALVPGIRAARSCMSLPPVRFRYRRYLPIRRPSDASLCAQKYTREFVGAAARTETERQTCGFGSTQQDLGTYRARIGEVRSQGEVEHEKWSMLDYDADGTRTENGKECPG